MKTINDIMCRIEDLLRSHSDTFKKPEPVKLFFMNGQFLRDIEATSSSLLAEEVSAAACISKLTHIISQLSPTEDPSNSRPNRLGGKFLSSKPGLSVGSKGYYLPSSFGGSQSTAAAKKRQFHGFRTPQELSPETSIILQREKANKSSMSAIKIESKQYQRDLLINLNQRDQKRDAENKVDETRKVERSISKVHLDPLPESSTQLKLSRNFVSKPSADDAAQEMITDFRKEDLSAKLDSKQTSNPDKLQTPKFTVKESAVPTKAFKNDLAPSPESIGKPLAAVSPSRSAKKKNTLNLSVATGIKHTRVTPADQPSIDKNRNLGSDLVEGKSENSRLKKQPEEDPQHPTNNRISEQKNTQIPAIIDKKQPLQDHSKPSSPSRSPNKKPSQVKFQLEASDKTAPFHEDPSQAKIKKAPILPAEERLLNKTSLHEGVRDSRDPANLNMRFTNNSSIEPFSPSLLRKHSTNQSQLIFRGSSYENLQSHTLSNLDYFDAHNSSINLSVRNVKRGNINQQYVEFGDQLQNTGSLLLTQTSSHPTIRSSA